MEATRLSKVFLRWSAARQGSHIPRGRPARLGHSKKINETATRGTVVPATRRGSSGARVSPGLGNRPRLRRGCIVSSRCPSLVPSCHQYLPVFSVIPVFSPRLIHLRIWGLGVQVPPGAPRNQQVNAIVERP